MGLFRVYPHIREIFGSLLGDERQQEERSITEYKPNKKVLGRQRADMVVWLERFSLEGTAGTHQRGHVSICSRYPSEIDGALLSHKSILRLQGLCNKPLGVCVCVCVKR